MGRPECGSRSSKSVIACPVTEPDSRRSRALRSAGDWGVAECTRGRSDISMLMQLQREESDVGEYGKVVRVEVGLALESLPAGVSTSLSRTSAALDARPKTEGASSSKSSSHSSCAQCGGHDIISRSS